MIVAIVALILPKPRGAKIQQIALPIIPSTLLSSSISTSNRNLPSTTPKQEPAQITIEESRIIVPALRINELPLSHIERMILPKVGQ